MKFEIYSTKLRYRDNNLLSEYPQLKEFDITIEQENILKHYITISSLEELEKLGKLLDERLIIIFEDYEIEIYDYYRE